MNVSSQIELATYDDLPGIKALLESVYVPTEGIDPHFTNFYIIREDVTNKTIGCIGLEVFTSTALLRSFAVDPNHQGKGFGSILVNKLLEEAIRSGAEVVYVCTAKVPALFMKIGFVGIDLDDVPEEIRKSKLFIDGCPHVAAFMKMKLI